MTLSLPFNMALSENIPLLFLLIFSGALIFSAVINNLLLSFSQNLGTRKKDAIQIRWNSTSKPALGGISFFVVFLISFISIQFIIGQTTIYFSDKKTLGILSSISIAFVMGLADDAYDTKPLVKSITQFICALMLIVTGTRIECFESEFINYTLTILWIIGMMNSINMLDNMDAITTVVSVGIFAFISAITIIQSHSLTPLAILSTAMLGGLTGFLIYNWHPSLMFMGDTGSQFLGIFLAIVGIEYCWNIKPDANNLFPVEYLSKSILVVASTFVMPLTDTATVVINRLSRGTSPFIGGKDHTTHHLFFNGLTEKKIAVLFFVLTSIGCYLSYHIIIDNDWNMQKFWLYSLFPTLVFTPLFLLTHYKKKKIN